MPAIMNKSKTQSKAIELANGKFLHLLPRGKAEVTQRDLMSSHLAGFLKRREVVVLQEAELPQKAKKEVKKRGGSAKKAKQKEKKKAAEVKTEETIEKDVENEASWVEETPEKSSETEE